MHIFSPSPRPTSPTTFLLPLGPGPEAIPDDRARVHVPRQTASTSGATRTGVGERPVSRASAGAWPDDPMRTPSNSLEDAGSTTAGLATSDGTRDRAPAPNLQEARSEEDASEQSVVDATASRPSRADQVRAQARAAKLQMRAQAETARRAQAHATGAVVHDLIE
ncbi:hypothetical protein [Salinibacter ruber]|uniref:Uncharacterized protein n=1 Tax=Salinibacter ruber TaxID=146919 RepID=A0A9X2R6X2_9BACT|nr:hypothetical protein [Salinibacter ruber]MCS3857297.1 hypothetical protein [Salinibacter ruber]MCS3864123.1 hypothetical protein [Salinibacter ruber]MCS4150902.1 hypothetical protein [Salinibacter ruber]